MVARRVPLSGCFSQTSVQPLEPAAGTDGLVNGAALSQETSHAPDQNGRVYDQSPLPIPEASSDPLNDGKQ